MDAKNWNDRKSIRDLKHRTERAEHKRGQAQAKSLRKKTSAPPPAPKLEPIIIEDAPVKPPRKSVMSRIYRRLTGGG